MVMPDLTLTRFGSPDLSAKRGKKAWCYHVFSYDTPDNRRRTQVIKALKDFGAHMQYSVFE
jgi:hypothetical protein